MISRLPKHRARAQLNSLGRQRTPCLFILDYELEQCIVYPVDEVSSQIHYCLHEQGNDLVYSPLDDFDLKSYPIDYCEYEIAFDKVRSHIKYGNSFLLNLSMPTPVEMNADFLSVYRSATAKYRLLIEDELVVFSPEIFVQIDGGIISSYPMKGTIDASKDNAQQKLLRDEKESAEHATIVDLIRNDLSLVAKDVRVERYRYLDHLKTSAKDLYQSSSKVSGTLPEDYEDHLGDIIMRLLPAGSITGAPKPKTVEVIAEAEGQKRGYYTGIMGIYNGAGQVDTGVLIRCIEKRNGQLYYRSGCGITHRSDCQTEYLEMIDKIYVPIL